MAVLMSLSDISMSLLFVAKGVILPIWMLVQIALKGISVLYSRVSAHLRGRAELLLSGQFDAMIACYHFSLPVFLPTGMMLLRSAEDARAVLGLMRDALRERGVVALRPQINAVDLPRAGRFRVWVDWHELAIPAKGTRISSAIYYCRLANSGLQTEMVNYTRHSMPELNSQIAALALSA
jgi:hypothetical protein